MIYMYMYIYTYTCIYNIYTYIYIYHIYIYMIKINYPNKMIKGNRVKVEYELANARIVNTQSLK